MADMVDNPLAITREEWQAKKAREQAEIFSIPDRPRLEVVTAESIKLDRAPDRSSNPSLRGELLGWVIDKEQAHMKGFTPERRFFLIWKKAQSLYETRLHKRLPNDKVKKMRSQFLQGGCCVAIHFRR